MKENRRKEVIDNMLKLRSSISARLEERNQEVDNIGYYKDFEFKGSGLAINNAYIVKLRDTKKVKDKAIDEEEQERIAFEIYDEENNLIATVDETGKIEFDEAYLESLREMNEEYFNTLTLDEAEFELPEELGENDLVLNGQELDEKQTEKELAEIEELTGEKAKSYSTMKTDQTPKFEKMTNKQEIDPNVRVTQTETLSDMIPELKEKGIVKVGVVYSDHGKGQSGRFSFVGLDKDGNMQAIDSLQNIEGTTTGQKVTSINSHDGSLVQEEQVAGMVRINGRNKINGQEEMLSVKVGDYGILEVDYVRSDPSRDKDKRYLSAPIETSNQLPTTREVREMMDKTYNTDIEDELDRAQAETDRDGETQVRNIDDTATNDLVGADDILIRDDGSKITLRQIAIEQHSSVDEIVEMYNNEVGGKTVDEKIENIEEELEDQYRGGPSRSRG